MSDPTKDKIEKNSSQGDKQSSVTMPTSAAVMAGSDDSSMNDLREQLAAAQAKAEEAEKRAEKAEEDIKLRNESIDNEVTRQEETVKRQLRSQRKVRIVINSGKSQHEQCPVALAVNGREFLIERDKEVDVPQGVLNVLDLAKELVPSVIEENGQARAIFRPTQRFSYTTIGYVSPDTGALEK